MNRLRLWRQNFNWRMFVVRIIVNALALLFTMVVLPNVIFVNRSFLNLLLLALVLGFLNAFIKPVIAFLTLRFIFATGGLVLAVINGVILALLSWLFPEMLRVQTILSALLGGIVLGLSSAFLEALLGLNPPIVAEKYPEIRERIQDRQFYRKQMVPARIAAKSELSMGEFEAEAGMQDAAPAELTAKSAETLAPAPAMGDENKAFASSTTTEPEA